MEQIIKYEQFSTNLNQTESESCSDLYNMCNIVGKEIPFMKKIQPNHCNLNYFKSEFYNNNIINNKHNIRNEFSNKKL